MSAQATERRAARYEAQSALDGKAQWRFVTNECCVADVDHCLLVRTKVSTAQNPKGRPVVFAFHREARVLYAPRNDGYTSGEVFPVDLSHVPARLRAAVVCGLTMDKDAREWVQEHRNGKHQNEPAERAESEATMPPTNPKPVTLAVRKDEKRMTLVQRTFTVELTQARLLDLVRSTGADVPADAQAQVVWADREDKPHLGRADAIAITWSRSEESVES